MIKYDKIVEILKIIGDDFKPYRMKSSYFIIENQPVKEHAFDYLYRKMVFSRNIEDYSEVLENVNTVLYRRELS